MVWRNLSKAAIAAFAFFLLLASVAAVQAEQHREGGRLVNLSRTALDPAGKSCLAAHTRYELPGAVFPDEPQLARHPEDLRVSAVVWQSNAGIHVRVTSDAGQTWSPLKTMAFNACADGDPAATSASDPWVSIGPDGAVYVSGIAFTPSKGFDAGGDLVSQLLVAVSNDGGHTWSEPVAAAKVVQADGISHDNLAVLADPIRPGNVYLTTTRYQAVPGSDSEQRYGGAVGFIRSTDKGESWEQARTITRLFAGGRVSAPEMAIDPDNGRIYVAYYRETKTSRDTYASVIWSDDAGDSWSNEVDVAPVARLSDSVVGTAHGTRHLFAADILHITTDRPSGQPHIVFVDQEADSSVLRVWVSTSYDKGATWTQPARVDRTFEDSPAFLPTVAVNDRGIIGVAYYDFRRMEGRPVGVTLPTSVWLATFVLDESGAIVDLEETEIARFNMLGAPRGHDVYGVGDYIGIAGLSTNFEVAFVQSNCGPLSIQCATDADPPRYKDAYVYLP